MAQSTWNGDKVRRRVLKAVERGVNVVMAAAVLQAKLHHPGWRNITALAEGSVRVITLAKRSGNAISGEWGSVGTGYVLWLELNHGSFLRNAADKEYPKLAKAIRGSLARSAASG
jgi:hypothetical protein